MRDETATLSADELRPHVGEMRRKMHCFSDEGGMLGGAILSKGFFQHRECALFRDAATGELFDSLSDLSPILNGLVVLEGSAEAAARVAAAEVAGQPHFGFAFTSSIERPSR